MEPYVSCWRCCSDPYYYVEVAEGSEDVSSKRGRLSVLTRSRDEQLLGNVVWGVDAEGRRQVLSRAAAPVNDPMPEATRPMLG